MKNLCQLLISERGAQILKMPDGTKLPGIYGIKVEQELDHMRVGIANVTLNIWVSTKPQENEIINGVETVNPQM